MQIVMETSLSDFEAWSGGLDTLNSLKCWLSSDEFDTLEAFIEESFDYEQITDTQLNDFLWFETDAIASCFGYDSWEAWEKAQDGEDEEEEEEDEEY